MTYKVIDKLKKDGVYKIYFYAILIYVLPLLSLGLFIIDQFTVNMTEMVFWVLFLFGMLPCGFIGLVLSIIGLKKSMKRKSKLNIVIGVVGCIGGLVSIVGGIFGIMLIYLVVGG